MKKQKHATGTEQELIPDQARDLAREGDQGFGNVKGKQVVERA